MQGDTCPVVQSYIDEGKEYFRALQGPMGDLYSVPIDHLDGLADLVLAKKADEHTQLLRGFHCLHGLFVLLLAQPGFGAHRQHKLEMTREGVRKLRANCIAFKRDTEVGLYISQLVGPDSRPLSNSLKDYQRKVNMELATVIIEACEHLRPRIRTPGSLTRMGKLYMQGMRTTKATSDSVLSHGRALVHTAAVTQGEENG